MEKAPIYFVTGGVRSGKSTFAEELTAQCSHELNRSLIYIACGRARDGEMSVRIRKHQEQREQSKLSWQTREFPTDIKESVKTFDHHPVALLDCLTTLLDNELFSTSAELDEKHANQVFNKIIAGLEKIQREVSTLVIVSNEVLHEYSHFSAVQLYQRTLGLLHQEIVKRAERAYLIESGLPIMMKGKHPGMERI